MTKSLRLVLALAFAITFQLTAVSQSLSINTTGAAADPSAILDVTSTAKGMLIPRMDKTQKNAIATPANGLMVYQTGPDSIGFHYYDLPNTRWVFINTNGFANDTTAWKLTGNNNVADTSFLGSINNKAVKFRVNNIPSGIIDSTTGDAGLGYRALATTHSFPGFYANNAIGFGAGQNLNSGYGNSAMGRHALSLTGASTQNVAIGDSAMGTAVSIGGTTALGYQALKQINGVGFFTYNTAVGYASQSGPTGSINGPFSYYNTSVGGFAMADNKAGYDNTAVGVSALRFNDSSASNTAIGINAMAYHKRSGFNSNVAVGSFALENDSLGVWNTVVGSEAMQNAKRGGVNVAVGFRSMKAHKDGGENTAVGVGSLEADSSGTQNTAIGRSALFLNKIGARNTVVGAEAGVFNNSGQTNPLQGSENTYVGFNSGRTANLGRKNAVLGAYALEGSGTYGDLPTLDAYSRNSVVGDSAALRTFGNDNVAIGFKALNTNGGNSQHVAVGSRALANTSASYPNTAVGYSSMDSATTGSANTAVGSYSLTANKTGINNVAVGNAAMYQSPAGSNNTAVGNDAGRFINSNQNTAIGSAALRNDSTGIDNVAAGYQASFTADTASQTTAIGRSALLYNLKSENTAVGSNAARLGNFNPAVTSLHPTRNTENTAIGFRAMNSNATGRKNVAVGYRAFAIGPDNSYTYETGSAPATLLSRNVAIGDSAMAVYTGSSGIAIGADALGRAGFVFNNIAIGDSAMGNTSTTAANDNVAVGYKTLSQVRNQGNIAMGAYAGQKLANTVWNTAIGYHALETDTTGSENTVIGTSAFRSNANGIRNASLGINTGYWIKGSNNTFLGSYAGEGSSTGSTSATSNTAVGFVALRNIRSGNQNTALGEYALSADTSGSLNVAVGAGSMESHLRGDDNVAMGFWAGRQDTAAQRNVYIGRNAGYSNQRDDIIAIGYQALFNNSVGAVGSNEGTNNTAIGSNALLNNTLGERNTAIGPASLSTNTTGKYNTAIGNNALAFANTDFNTAVGDYALGLATGSFNTIVGSNAAFNLTGTSNTGMGVNVLAAANNASRNIAIGRLSLFNNTTGSGNTAVGYYTGRTNIIGNQLTLIGDSADVTVDNLANASAIGYRAAVGQNNSLVLGSINGINGATADTKVGIRTTTPDSTFSVADNFLVGSSGTVQYDNSVPVMNYMFKSGFSNADRMVIAHSTAAPNWGLQYQDASDQFNFIGNGINRMAIELGTGQVGIGVANPGFQLELSTNSAAKPTSSTWIISSDSRLKTFDGNYTKGLADILKLNTIMYHYAPGNARNLPTDEQGYGFSAQEVQKIFPEAVKVGKDGYLTLDLHPVFVSYINAFKDQQLIIDKQQKTIDDLLKRVEKLEKK